MKVVKLIFYLYNNINNKLYLALIITLNYKPKKKLQVDVSFH